MQYENQLVNYTDHSFQKLCEKKYGINRGVYNTIDSWFYEKGIKNIISRRKEILSFLSFIAYRFSLNQPSKLRFGSGGLVNKLEEFWNEVSSYYRVNNG
ncbi:hypothetical protein DCC39_16135 [Pueribacillus theae]|uniref:Uncharacterized protein n=1 Tax=Pueribacillus theae TaxID=2171751 RepID=A0A2U1JSA2_9BACI|nr:hypothetical protein [Pueribacillus theae]PWA07824.1 hypothetical protein DCC39_16135 [Pueribacillus theae]